MDVDDADAHGSHAGLDLAEQAGHGRRATEDVGWFAVVHLRIGAGAEQAKGETGQSSVHGKSPGAGKEGEAEENDKGGRP